MEKIKLPKKDRPTGLFLYCNECKNLYINDSVVDCKHHSLVYKAKIHVPGSIDRVKCRVLKANDFNTACNLLFAFKNELISNSFQKVIFKKEANTPILLIECFAYYMGFLNNVDVPKHKQKERSPRYIQKFDADFELYKEILKYNNIDYKILKFTNVNEDMVGFIHDYFLNNKRYAEKTYNNAMANYSQFTTFIINKFKFDYENPFHGVKLEVTPKRLSMHEDEFSDMLKLVTKENGNKILNRKSRGTNYVKNLYRPWLRHGFLLALFTGGRSEELVNLSWNGITLNQDNSFDKLKVIHYKLDKAKSHLRGKKNHILKEFTITNELGELLKEMGYESKKNSQEFILAPERTTRMQVGRELSTAFSHYYGLLRTDKEIKFKNLRKTFITSAYHKYGSASIALTDHAHPSMVEAAYYDRNVTQSDAQKNFQVFKKKEENGEKPDS